MKEKKYMKRQKHKKIIIGGGGTGGHIFPAISVANALKRIDSSVDILFVGAEGKMEMELVPEAGYRIIGLPVAGFNRKLVFRNFSVLMKLLKSLSMARKIIKDFDPDAVVGFGGYASGPVLWQAERMKIPVLIQEQNSYAGVTNKILAGKASAICVAYDNMEKYFPKKRLLKREIRYVIIMTIQRILKTMHSPFLISQIRLLLCLSLGGLLVREQ